MPTLWLHLVDTYIPTYLLTYVFNGPLVCLREWFLVAPLKSRWLQEYLPKFDARLALHLQTVKLLALYSRISANFRQSLLALLKTR